MYCLARLELVFLVFLSKIHSYKVFSPKDTFIAVLGRASEGVPLMLMIP
jgi:hypothetical protein